MNRSQLRHVASQRSKQRGAWLNHETHAGRAVAGEGGNHANNSLTQSVPQLFQSQLNRKSSIANRKLQKAPHLLALGLRIPFVVRIGVYEATALNRATKTAGFKISMPNGFSNTSKSLSCDTIVFAPLASAQARKISSVTSRLRCLPSGAGS